MTDETYGIFREWDFDKTREENLTLARENNTSGAPSSRQLLEVSKVINRRYDPNGADRALVEMAKRKVPLEVWRPIQLWHMTRQEFLLRDFLTDWLSKEHESGAFKIRSGDLREYLEGLHERGLVEAPWSEGTIKKIATSLLKSAVHFELMTGSVAREFVSYHLPEQAFLYLLHALFEVYGNGGEVVRAADWRLYLMTQQQVESELLRLHQFRKLRYEVAGSLVELALPYESAAAYAQEMEW